MAELGGNYNLAEIERAVNLSYELAHRAGNDELKVQVNQYLQELNNSRSAWRIGLELFLQSNGEYTRFYGISRVIACLEDEERHSTLSMEERTFLRETCMGWVKSNLARLGEEPKYIRNKVGVLVAYLVRRDFPQLWGDAFQQLLLIANENLEGAALFLKALGYLTESIVTTGNEGQGSEWQQNMIIKDALRESTVLQEIVRFWQQVLVNFQSTDAKLVHMCMGVIRDYVGWIDIQLIVNQQFIPIFYTMLGDSKEYRVDALECFIHIIRKGMGPENKMKLIRSLEICSALQKVCEADNVNRKKGSDRKQQLLNGANGIDKNNNGNDGAGDDDDLNDGGDDDDVDDEDEFREKVSELVNEIGLRFISARIKLPKEEVEVHRYILEELCNRIVPLAVTECLGSGDIDAQEKIMEFLNKMLLVIKENEDLNLGQKNNAAAVRKKSLQLSAPDMELDVIFRNALPGMLPIILRNMCYPQDFTFDTMDEDEAEFEQHRKLLRRLFVNMTRNVALEAVLPFLQDAVRVTLNPEQPLARPPFEIEVTLALVHAFGEGAPPGVCSLTSRTLLEYARLGNQHFIQNGKENANNGQPQNDLDKAATEDKRRAEARSAFVDLVLYIHKCRLWLHPVPQVVMIYNELAARYAYALTFYPQTVNEHMLPVLEAMVGVGGLKHGNSSVRSQACYHLLRLVRALGSNIRPIVVQLLTLLREYLVVTYNAVLADMLQKEEEERIQRSLENGSPINASGENESSPTPPGFVKPMYGLDDTANLFELASVLLALEGPGDGMRQQLAEIMGPLHTKMEEIARDLQQQQQSRERLILGNWAAECVHVVALMCKGLGKMAETEVGDLFKTCLNDSLVVLSAVPEHDMLRTRILSLLHCIVSVFGESSLQFTPTIGIRLFEQSQTLNHVFEAMTFLNQLIMKYGATIYPVMEPALLPVIRHTLAALHARPDPFVQCTKTPGGGLGAMTSDMIEYRKIKRVLFGFLHGITSKNLDPILYSEKNVQHLPEVLKLVTDGLSTFPDSSCQKLCARVLITLCDQWLPATNTQVNPNVRNVFIQFLLETGSVASLRATTVISFDVQDFESLTMLEEVCQLHITLKTHLGDKWLQYLAETALPSASCPPNLAMEYVTKLADAQITPKALRKEFKRLFLGS